VRLGGRRTRGRKHAHLLKVRFRYWNRLERSFLPTATHDVRDPQTARLQDAPPRAVASIPCAGRDHARGVPSLAWRGSAYVDQTLRTRDSPGDLELCTVPDLGCCFRGSYPRQWGLKRSASDVRYGCRQCRRRCTQPLAPLKWRIPQLAIMDMLAVREWRARPCVTAVASGKRYRARLRWNLQSGGVLVYGNTLSP
jgi:hypothetical protein